MIADFYKVTANDLLDPGFIHRSTKHQQVDPTFDASKYEDFADEYPMPLTQLEHDPKMRATYDAILEAGMDVEVEPLQIDKEIN